MTHVTYYVAASVDGFIAPEDGSLDWLAPFSNGAEDHGYAAFYATVDALVVGSRTYEQMLSFGGWPHPDRPVTVMSSRPLPVAGGNVSLRPGEPGVVIDALAAAGLERIWLVGGGALAGSFERDGLIDEYVISFVPVILGSGIGLFGRGGKSRPLALVEEKGFGDGILQARYRRT